VYINVVGGEGGGERTGTRRETPAIDLQPCATYLGLPPEYFYLPVSYTVSHYQTSFYQSKESGNYPQCFKLVSQTCTYVGCRYSFHGHEEHHYMRCRDDSDGAW
jgi:hypothetical protein